MTAEDNSNLAWISDEERRMSEKFLEKLHHSSLVNKDSNKGFTTITKVAKNWPPPGSNERKQVDKYAQRRDLKFRSHLFYKWALLLEREGKVKIAENPDATTPSSFMIYPLGMSNTDSPPPSTPSTPTVPSTAASPLPLSYVPTYPPSSFSPSPLTTPLPPSSSGGSSPAPGSSVAATAVSLPSSKSGSGRSQKKGRSRDTGGEEVLSRKGSGGEERESIAPVGGGGSTVTGGVVMEGKVKKSQTRKKRQREGGEEVERPLVKQKTDQPGTIKTNLYLERFSELTSTIINGIQECELILKEACKQREENLTTAHTLAQQLSKMSEKKKQDKLMILQLQEEITSLRKQLLQPSYLSQDKINL